MGDTGPFKIVLLGEGRVGKTSLVSRFVRNTFDPKEMSSQSAAFCEKRVKIQNTTVNLAIWDTAGQERFHSLAPIYYREAHGAVIVYDITDMDSWNRVPKWISELQVTGTNCNIALVGNKQDLRAQARVPQVDAERYARSIGGKHFPVSCKLNEGVEAVFLGLAEDCLRRGGAGGGTGQSGRKSRVLVAAEDPPARVRKRDRCCGGGGGGGGGA